MKKNYLQTKVCKDIFIYNSDNGKYICKHDMQRKMLWTYSSQKIATSRKRIIDKNINNILKEH